MLAPKVDAAWHLHELTSATGPARVRAVLLRRRHLGQSRAGQLRRGERVSGRAGRAPPRARACRRSRWRGGRGRRTGGMTGGLGEIDRARLDRAGHRGALHRAGSRAVRRSVRAGRRRCSSRLRLDTVGAARAGAGGSAAGAAARPGADAGRVVRPTSVAGRSRRRLAAAPEREREHLVLEAGARARSRPCWGTPRRTRSSRSGRSKSSGSTRWPRWSCATDWTSRPGCGCRRRSSSTTPRPAALAEPSGGGDCPARGLAAGPAPFDAELDELERGARLRASPDDAGRREDRRAPAGDALDAGRCGAVAAGQRRGRRRGCESATADEVSRLHRRAS